MSSQESDAWVEGKVKGNCRSQGIGAGNRRVCPRNCKRIFEMLVILQWSQQMGAVRPEAFSLLPSPATRQ